MPSESASWCTYALLDNTVPQSPHMETHAIHYFSDPQSQGQQTHHPGKPTRGGGGGAPKGKEGWAEGGGGLVSAASFSEPQPAQPRHTIHWGPRTRKRHQQEHTGQRPTERSDAACEGETG